MCTRTGEEVTKFVKKRAEGRDGEAYPGNRGSIK